jgi:uncharacterized protein
MRIAIVGAGVSGLVAAHLLAREHEVVVYEAGSYAGGHTNTIRVDTAHETHHVDTGFIVMNDRNYPNFTRLLDQLGVATQDTNMSFSVKGEDEDFEYAGTPRGLFCQPSNLLSVHFQRMIADLLRFNRELRRLLAHDESGELPRRSLRNGSGGRGSYRQGWSSQEASPQGESLHDFLTRHRFSEVFIRRLIVPQVSAVWSADPRQISSFPVRFLAEFFANHGMLGFRDRPRWSTVAGGSARYVAALTRPLHERIRLNCPVKSISRAADHVEIVAEDRGHGSGRGGRDTQSFDQVVIAAHSDQALAMLGDASDREHEVLGAIPYQRNEAVLHTDSTLLPRRRFARAAWNFHLLREPKPLSTVTYYMNHLQRLRADRDFCVTLNRTEAIDPDKIIRTIDYSHPVFTPAGIAAQAQHAALGGFATRTHFCGAYWGWGFHEDGVNSALRVAAVFGAGL